MMAYRQSILGLAVLNHIANLDNINKDYVIVNEDGFCEFPIDNFIFQN